MTEQTRRYIQWLHNECPHALGDSLICGPCAREIADYLSRLSAAAVAVYADRDTLETCEGAYGGMITTKAWDALRDAL